MSRGYLSPQMDFSEFRTMVHYYLASIEVARLKG